MGLLICPREANVKLDWNKKYTTIAVYAFIVIAASIVFFLIVSEIEKFNEAVSGYISIIYPFIYGFIIAYIINFPLNFFARQIKKIPFMKKVKDSRVHILALIFAYILSGILVYLFIIFILPQLVASIAGLVMRIPDYIGSTTDYIEELTNEISIHPQVIEFLNDRWTQLADYINDIAAVLLPTLLSSLKSIAESFFNWFLGIFISVYMLAEKRKFTNISKKLIYGILNEKYSIRVLKISKRSHSIFSNFLVGKILDSAIMGVLTFIILSIAQMPYTLLVSFIVAITNIIPFFGPFIGAIPSFIIIFFESPMKGIWFIIIIIIIQQIDGNIIGPKVLGDTLGISAFWILFSVLVSGKLFGFIGMVIGVPLFVLIYSIVKEVIESRLEAKNLPIETDEYTDK